MIRIKTDKPHAVFAEVIEQGAIDQFESAMNQPFVVRGALMPDAHQGYSLPIGAVVANDGVILPSWVGYDIGCGMCALPTTFSAEQVRVYAKEIFTRIYDEVPTGFSHNQKPTEWDEGRRLPVTAMLHERFERDGLRQLGSLGGGNHFIEVGEDETGKVWIIIHSGSRGIGHAVATYYMRAASGDGKAREGHFGFDVGSDWGMDYATDMEFCLQFALENRREITGRVERVLIEALNYGRGEWPDLINRNHNHAELRDGLWIHRKGATHAEAGMMGVIPGNMRDGSFIVRGLGNPDALWSSSHGAGRVLGRKVAKKTLNMGDFESAMEGVTALVTADTLDESPFAYKDIFEVMRLQAGLVDVVAHVKPIINVKG
jgi:tRNA-splicing ligase RtcB